MMNKHNFKIGDRVKLKGGTYCGISGDDVGKVIDLHTYIKVSWGGVFGEKIRRLSTQSV